MYPIAKNIDKLVQFIKENRECRLNKDYDILFLEKEGLTSLPYWFGNIVNGDGRKYKIKSLFLSGNEITSIDNVNTFGNLESLEALYLGNNKFTNIPSVVSQLPILRSLHLTKNQITHIPSKLFTIDKLQNLENLHLNNNQLTSLSHTIGNLQNLRRLNLSDNQLKSLPDTIGNLLHLISLHVIGNQLETLPDTIGNLYSLQVLYLSNNPLITLPATINNLNLSELKTDVSLAKFTALTQNNQIWSKKKFTQELSLTNTQPRSLLRDSFSKNHPLFAQVNFIRNLDDYSLDFLREYTDHYFKQGYRKKQIDKIIENIFKQIPATTQEFKVYRGVTTFPFEKERNFISTSMRQEVAHNFVNKDKSGCCILVITVKTGSKVLPLKEISQYPDEDELLLHGNGVYLIKQERLTNTGLISEPKTKVKRSVPKSMTGSQTLAYQSTVSTKNYKMKKYYIDYFYSGPMSSLESLKIITMNIGARIQMNIEEGSEKEFVQLCKAIYPNTSGLSSVQNQSHILSQCSLNAAQWLASQNVGLIGLQETVVEYLPLFMTAFKPNYQCVGHDSACIIYDELQLGKPIMLSTKGLFVGGDNRPMVILWFPEPKLLAVTLHAEHNINLKMEITKAFNSVMSQQSIISQMGIKNEEDVERIIVMGDFNDGQGTLQSLHLFGLTLKQHSHLSIFSCCADSNYKYQGDYIFDSDFNLLGNYGTPLTGFHPYEKKSGSTLNAYNLNNWKAVNDNLPMSDHDPVVFYPGL